MKESTKLLLGLGIGVVALLGVAYIMKSNTAGARLQRPAPQPQPVVIIQQPTQWRPMYSGHHGWSHHD